MLNGCIERKKSRESSVVDTRQKQTSCADGDADSPESPTEENVAGSSDEEFYECTDEETDPSSVGIPSWDQLNPEADGDQSMQESIVSADSMTSYADTFSHQPEGRLKAWEGLALLHVSEPLYVPITQEPAPMTEDMLDEHAEVLAK